MPSSPALLIVGASESNADLLYATRFFVPDAIVWFKKEGKTYGVLSPLEIDRAKKTATIDEILAWSNYQEKLEKQIGRKAEFHEILLSILTDHQIQHVRVPESFPVYLADQLRKNGLTLESTPGLFFPERMIKRADEIEGVIRGQRQAEAGLARGIEVLQESTIQRDRLLNWNGEILTSEILRGEIDSAVIKMGGLPAHTIVACGDQSCDPHERGHGPLRAHQSIILDIFPRDQKTYYFGDLTRTVVKGQATDALHKLHQTVYEGQKLALSKIRPGAKGSEIHQEVIALFESRGFKTEQKNGRWIGFFHGTGHGVGLEIHEPPRFAAATFEIGHVTTVEPGLYYPGIGGVRLEDIVVVEKNGIRNLTEAKHLFELD